MRYIKFPHLFQDTYTEGIYVIKNHVYEGEWVVVETEHGPRLAIAGGLVRGEVPKSARTFKILALGGI